MSTGKNRAWWLFFLTFILASVIFILTLVMKWQDIKKEHLSEQANKVRLLKSAIEARFIQYDGFLERLARQLIDNQTYLNKAKSRAIFRQILASEPTIAGFGLVDPKGYFLVVNKDLDESLLPNLLEQEHIAQSFKNALQSNSIVVGRHYFNKEIGDWVIPFRKAIRNATGEVVYVMTFGVFLEQVTELLLNKFPLVDGQRIVLIRAEDRYHQLALSNNSEEERYYTKTLPLGLYTKLTDMLKRSPHDSLAQENKEESVFVVEGIDEQGHRILCSAIYDSRFNSWVVLDTQYTALIAAYVKSISVLLLVFSLGVALLFFALRVTANKEQAKQKAK